MPVINPPRRSRLGELKIKSGAESAGIPVEPVGGVVRVLCGRGTSSAIALMRAWKGMTVSWIFERTVL